LPALSTILKIRKRKLAQVTTNNSSTTVLENSSTVSTYSNGLIVDFASKLAVVDNNVTQPNILGSTLTFFLVKFETSRKLKIDILNQVQLTTLLYI